MQNDLISRSALIAEHCSGCDVLADGLCDYDVCGSVQLMMEAPAVDAVPVERLGKIGKLFLPYKGCSRGHVGRMGAPATLEEEALFWGVITDVDGGRWVPVVEAVLMELIEKAKANDPESLRPKGRWENVQETVMYVPEMKYTTTHTAETCSACKARVGFVGPKVYLYDQICPSCGAKMRGEADD